MAPDTDLELQVVITALENVIQPAIDPGNPAAAEQLRLVLLVLRHVKSHQPLAAARVHAELAAALRLADAVQAVAADPLLETSIASARSVLANLSTAEPRLNDSRRELQAIVAEIVRRPHDPTLRAAIDKAVILGSKEQLDLTRAWFAGSGHEPDPDAVPLLATLL